MNRVLYQLSYAAIVQVISHHEISFVIISKECPFVKRFLKKFLLYFGNGEIMRKTEWNRKIPGISAGNL